MLISFAKSDLALLPKALGQLTIDQYLLLTQGERKVKIGSVHELKAWEQWMKKKQDDPGRKILKAEQMYRLYAGFDASCETSPMRLNLE